MAELRDVVGRLKLGHGVRDIQRSTGVHRTIIRRLRDLAGERGWLEAGVALPTEEQIEEPRRGGTGELLAHRLDAHKDEIKRWMDRGYSYVVMHDLIRSRVPCSEATVWSYPVSVDSSELVFWATPKCLYSCSIGES